MLNDLTSHPPTTAPTPGRRRPRLALLTAIALASMAFLGAAPAAPASAAPAFAGYVAQNRPPCDGDPNDSAIPASVVEFGGTMYADSNGFLANSMKIASTAGSSGWHSALLSYYGNYLLQIDNTGNVTLDRIQWTGYISCAGGPTYFAYHLLDIYWSTRVPTSGFGPCFVTMQGDGNLVTYYSQGALWASNSSGWPHTTAYRLVVQDDSNLVIYLGSQVIWDRINGSYR